MIDNEYCEIITICFAFKKVIYNVPIFIFRLIPLFVRIDNEPFEL